MAKVSIIVPVYQVEKYLKRCVDSLIRQTFTDFEIVLVDDESLDASGLICDGYSMQDNRIHVIHQEHSGLSAARNTGLEYVFSIGGCEWITFVDSDDWVHPEYLNALLSAADRYNLEIAACGHVKVRDKTPDTLWEGGSSVWDTGDYYKNRSTAVWGKLYSKKTIGDLRFPEGRIYEDEFFVYKALFQYHQIAYIDQPLYYYFQNNMGIMRKKWTPNRLDAVDALEEQLAFFEERGYEDLAKHTYHRLLRNIKSNLDNLQNCKDISDQERQQLFYKLEDQQRVLTEKYRGFDIGQNNEDRDKESKPSDVSQPHDGNEVENQIIENMMLPTKEHNTEGRLRYFLQRLKEDRFMFEELVKRDFKKKYKRTVLGMGWSVLSPLLTLLVMRLVFTRFFGRNMAHYTTYLFAGNLVFSYFKEQTSGGMYSLMSNAHIFTKINVPKYMFLIAKCVSAVINFALTLVVFFIFVVIDKVSFSPTMFAVIYPIITLTMFNIGVGMILSALYVFFRDTQYLYDVFTLLLMYVSAIFYTVDNFPLWIQRVFLLNPVYCNIKYVRVVVLDGNLPSLPYHLLLLGYGAVALLIGGIVYKKCNQKFLYYV